MRTKLAIEVEYLGARFIGWQPQPAVEGTSVFEAVHAALQAIGIPGGPVASGRTDKGTNAMSNWLTITVRRQPAMPGPERDAELDTLCRTMNENLPADVRCLRIVDAPLTAHAITGSDAKTYSYFVMDGCIGECSSAWHDGCWVLADTLDVQAMRAALPGLVGFKDFRQLCAIQDPRRDTRRTIHHATISSLTHHAFPLLGCFEQTCPYMPIPKDACTHCCPAHGQLAIHAADVDWLVAAGELRPRLLQMQFAGDGFLKHQVRRIVGLLVAIGQGIEDPGATSRATLDPAPKLNVRGADHVADGTRRVLEAPATGLWLESVDCRSMLGLLDPTVR